jgi:hypothetical protein
MGVDGPNPSPSPEYNAGSRIQEEKNQEVASHRVAQTVAQNSPSSARIVPNSA